MSGHRASSPGTPRWAKVFWLVLIGVILALAILALVGSGEHGPGRHAPSGEPAGQIGESTTGDGPPAGGHTPPPFAPHP